MTRTIKHFRLRRTPSGNVLDLSWSTPPGFDTAQLSQHAFRQILDTIYPPSQVAGLSRFDIGQYEDVDGHPTPGPWISVTKERR